ncbi:MAG: hypothetical protein KBC00_03095 [Candidatus Levybacteria bacterium]|nr:hypothetical protein [Candidatus Levybacteria bacterium]MBP9815500.1 hypothetical protein [Candidatus Levybacteria bacterium]
MRELDTRPQNIERQKNFIEKQKERLKLERAERSKIAQRSTQNPTKI